MINRENYIVIQGWMVSELHLKGNELLVYAIIYGFSQSENQVFSGSLKYLSDWVNSTKRGIQKNLKSLIEKGVIEKNEKYINGVKFVEYYATKFYGIEHSSMGGIEHSSTNNIDINNIEYNINNNIIRDTDDLQIKNNWDEDVLCECRTKQGHICNRRSTYKINGKNYCNQHSKPIISDEIMKKKKYFENEEVNNIFVEYLELRKKMKAINSERAITLLVNKLNEYDDDIKIKMIEQSIENSWKSVYPLKKQESNKKESFSDVLDRWAKE